MKYEKLDYKNLPIEIKRRAEYIYSNKKKYECEHFPKLTMEDALNIAYNTFNNNIPCNEIDKYKVSYGLSCLDIISSKKKILKISLKKKMNKITQIRPKILERKRMEI